MCSMSNNIKCTSYNDANEVNNKLFESLISGYLDNLETSMGANDFNFYSVQLMYYKCHKINFKRSSSYIDSPDWIKNKKATLIPKNEDGKCIQYAATAALNYKEIESYLERVSDIIPFINFWKEINYPSKTDDWKKFERNNLTISLNISYTKGKKYFQLILENITQHVKNK